MRQSARMAAAFLALIPFWGLALAVNAAAQSEIPEPPAPPAPPAAGSNLLNPNISAIGWFQAEVGDDTDEEGTSIFELREVELGYQAAVDPYSRADFFIAVSPAEGIDLEEGYLTLLALPAGLSAKLGKFRSNFGKFNRTHPPETAFADRPIIAERFFGEEGLSGMGVSASWLAPLPFYLNLDAEVTNTPDSEEAPAFAPYRGKDLLYLGRASGFFNWSEASNLNLGVSYADGANGSAPTDTLGSLEALRARVVGADVTFRWRNPRRAIYRSFLAQIEWSERSAEELGGPDRKSHGGFAYADYQFARRWHAGARYDWADDVTGVLGFLTFTPSEFALMSLQARHQDSDSGGSETRFFLKTTFSIGPHGQHPF